jgi:hypothetical protein
MEALTPLTNKNILQHESGFKSYADRNGDQVKMLVHSPSYGSFEVYVQAANNAMITNQTAEDK